MKNQITIQKVRPMLKRMSLVLSFLVLTGFVYGQCGQFSVDLGPNEITFCPDNQNEDGTYHISLNSTSEYNCLYTTSWIQGFSSPGISYDNLSFINNNGSSLSFNVTLGDVSYPAILAVGVQIQNKSGNVTYDHVNIIFDDECDDCGELSINASPESITLCSDDQNANGSYSVSVSANTSYNCANEVTWSLGPATSGLFFGVHEFLDVNNLNFNVDFSANVQGGGTQVFTLIVTIENEDGETSFDSIQVTIVDTCPIHPCDLVYTIDEVSGSGDPCDGTGMFGLFDENGNAVSENVDFLWSIQGTTQTQPVAQWPGGDGTIILNFRLRDPNNPNIILCELEANFFVDCEGIIGDDPCGKTLSVVTPSDPCGTYTIIDDDVIAPILGANSDYSIGWWKNGNLHGDGSVEFIPPSNGMYSVRIHHSDDFTLTSEPACDEWVYPVRVRCRGRASTNNSDLRLGNPDNLSIYPNPSINGNVTLELKDEVQFEENLTYTVYDIMGKMVDSGQFNNQSKITIDIPNIVSGLHQSVLTDQNGNVVSMSSFVKL